MKKTTTALLILLAASNAAAVVTLTSAPGSRLRLDGDSTLHPYWSETTKIEAAFTVEQATATAADAAAAVAAGRPASLTVKIPVATLKSEHSGLDKNLRSALKAEKNPDIVFQLDDYRAAAEPDSLKVAASGTLNVAGSTRPVTVEGTTKIVAGRLVIDGAHSLLMSDFGVKPPKMMMGAIKTADKVTIAFHLELALPEKAIP